MENNDNIVYKENKENKFVEATAEPITELKVVVDFDWSFVSKVYCISLSENITVREEFTKECESIQLPNVEFHVVERHPEGGMVGCFTSHCEVIQAAWDAGHANVLVFEDDARFFRDRMTPSNIKALEQTLVGKDWDLVYFGHMPYPLSRITETSPSSSTSSSSRSITTLAKSDRSWMSHSYLVSRKMMRSILDNQADVQHYDAYLHEYSSESTRYVVYPMLYYQDDRPGTVSATWLLSNVMSLENVARTAETMSVHYMLTICLLTISVIIMVAILVFILLKILGISSSTCSSYRKEPTGYEHIVGL